MILENIHTDFRDSLPSTDSSKYSEISPNLYIYLHTYNNLFRFCVCVHPPRNMFCFSAVEIVMGNNTASCPVGLRHHIAQSPSTKIWNEYICTVVGLSSVHLFCILSTILTYTVQNRVCKK